MSGTSSNATGEFYTSNGQIISPTGTVFTAEGINVTDWEMGDAAQILAAFPHLNFVRLNVFSYQSPSAYAAFIQTMTAAGVVVELEDHTNSTGANGGGGQGVAFTGSQLSNELNWYSSMASAYASNPYVWFGTDNEPPQAGLSTWEQETYNAIRNTGNTNPIMIELPGGGDPSENITSYGMTPSVYAAMSNIVVDAHFYGWSANYSTNQQTVDSAVSNLVQEAQTITSADGTVPVIIGEYGPSTDGTTTDANASQVLQAVQQAASSGVNSGAVAWGWSTGQNDNLSDGSGNLTSYGQEVEQWIASTAPVAVVAKTTTAGTATSPLPAPPTPSANDTVVKAGSTAAITDASGNAWTITSGGQVAVNGVIDAATANVTELAYVGGTIWQENSSALWWGETQPNDSWAPTAGTATSPLPAPPTPSANDTVVKAGSTAAITDASGNAWTITSGGQVAVNGVTDAATANVTELAYVGGTIWQENSSALWWGETQPNDSWAPTAGTATSPLPAPPTPSANDTVVKAGSTAAITDASGNAWTITSGGQVAVNGVTDAATANVTELAYVGGTIWQENSSALWWGETQPNDSWAPTAGTATSPLPAPPTPSANDAVVKAGSTAAITDASGNAWTITSGGQVAVNGVTDAATANVIELAYVNGTIWQENSANLWWGETKPNDSWAPAAGTATSPLPAPVASTNDTVVQDGSASAIVDARGNAWTITSTDQVAVNGVTDTSTANVKQLAYVNGEIWQENASGLWWGKTMPTAAWSPTLGTTTSPLPTSITITANQASETVSMSQISVVATTGTHMLFISGTGDTVNLSGGTDTITDTGTSNTYVLPAAGAGYDIFTSDILTGNDKLDLRTALAATKWNGSTSTLSKYLSVATSSQGAVLSIAPTSGGAGVAIATVDGASTASLSTFLAHALT